MKKGDLVRVIGNRGISNVEYHNFPIGTIVTVEQVNDNGTVNAKYSGDLLIKRGYITRNLFQVVERLHLELVEGGK